MTARYCHPRGKPQAPWIVFVPGGGPSGRMWQPQLERLPDYYCLAPDLPEHGQSADIKPFTWHGSALLVDALIWLGFRWAGPRGPNALTFDTHQTCGV
jgi:pimeloyl-ACP methyl ester carboxylesterase